MFEAPAVKAFKLRLAAKALGVSLPNVHHAPPAPRARVWEKQISISSLRGVTATQSIFEQSVCAWSSQPQAASADGCRSSSRVNPCEMTQGERSVHPQTRQTPETCGAGFIATPAV
jgi:hypothetical protein